MGPLKYETRVLTTETQHYVLIIMVNLQVPWLSYCLTS